MRAALFACLSLSLLAPVAFADGASEPLPPLPGVRTVVAPTPPSAVPPAPTPAPVVSLTPIVLDETTARCKPLAKRASVPSFAQQLSARIALASCIADARIEPLSLIDGQESVLAIEEAVQPAFAMLDEVVDTGDASVKVMALRAKADLYTMMSMRMMSTVPAPANTTPEAASLRETRRQIVDGMIMPWHERSRETHRAIVDLGKKHPELVRNPVVQTAIRDSQRQLAQTSS
jgi:hypothetical protein